MYPHVQLPPPALLHALCDIILCFLDFSAADSFFSPIDLRFSVVAVVSKTSVETYSLSNAVNLAAEGDNFTSSVKILLLSLKSNWICWILLSNKFFQAPTLSKNIHVLKNTVFFIQ